MIWWILSAAAVIVLLRHWNSRNAVWGTATFGALVAAVAAIVRSDFEWVAVGKGFVIGTFIGLAFEWLPRIAQRSHGIAEKGPVELESIRDKLTENDIDELFSFINDNKKASETDKSNARRGLSKLLGKERAIIPTESEIASLSKFFSRDLIDVLLQKRSI